MNMTPELPLFLAALMGSVATSAAVVRLWVFAKNLVS